MAIELQETFGSRESVDSASAKSSTLRTFTAIGDADEQNIILAVLAATGATWGDLERGDVTVTPVNVDENNEAKSLWNCTVEYVSPEEIEPETGDSEYSFETGGGRQHITQSLETTSATIDPIWTPQRDAPDFQGAIGVTDQAVEGCDIIVPVFNWAETHYLAVAIVDQAYKMTLFNLTGTVNAAEFKGFARGECLFLGASGNQRGVEDWKIRFGFESLPNRVDLAVGNITVAAKLGHEWIWVRYEEFDDADAMVLVKRPLAAYTERVYPFGDFALLDIGVGGS